TIDKARARSRARADVPDQRCNGTADGRELIAGVQLRRTAARISDRSIAGTCAAVRTIASACRRRVSRDRVGDEVVTQVELDPLVGRVIGSPEYSAPLARAVPGRFRRHPCRRATTP